MGRPVRTIGHSTRTAQEFLDLLRHAGVRLLVDVRRYPASRRHPHFSAGALAASLAAAGITYRHEPDLGGHRMPRPDSENTAWTHPAFRGYADHMAGAAFRAALDRLVESARDVDAAVMCAEALPERCHRRLLADALTVRGVAVEHLVGSRDRRPHVLHPAARPYPDGRLLYPSSESDQRPLFDASRRGRRSR
jgi:uncharacterized protein (DUF488 family)